MSEPIITPAQIEEARNAGFSDTQIAEHIGKITGRSDQVSTALKENFDPTDVVSHLASIYAPKSEIKKPEQGDILRGAANTFRQLPQLLNGLVAGEAAVGEKILGEGGAWSGAKDKAVSKYREASESLAANSKESDSLTYSWDQAKQGNYGALVDWMQYGLGYAAGQGSQMLATGGIGSLAGKTALKGMAEQAASGMVAKEATKIAERQLGKGATEKAIAEMAATDAVKAQAVSSTAASIGQNTALGMAAFGMEGGEIYGDLVSDHPNASGADLAKAFAATLAAGGLEFVGDKVGLDLMLGKGAAKVGGGRAVRALSGGGAGILTEGGTEYLQTGAEELGKGTEKNLMPWDWSAETKAQAFDAAGLGAIGGAVMGGVGGALHKPEDVGSALPKTDGNLSNLSTVADKIQSSPDVDTAINNAHELLDEHNSSQINLNAARHDVLSAKTGIGAVNEFADFIGNEKADLEQKRQEAGLAQWHQAEAELANERQRMIESIRATDARVAEAEANKLLPSAPIDSLGVKEAVEPAPAIIPPVDVQRAKVDEFLANGFKPVQGGKVLINDSGKKYLLNLNQREYVNSLSQAAEGTAATSPEAEQPATPIQEVRNGTVNVATSPAMDTRSAQGASVEPVGSGSDGVLRHDAATTAGRDGMPGTSLETDGTGQSVQSAGGDAVARKSLGDAQAAEKSALIPVSQRAEPTVNSDFAAPVVATKKPKVPKAATLLTMLRDLGGVSQSSKSDVVGDKFAPGGYNQVFRKDAKNSIESHVGKGELDEFLPYEMRFSVRDNSQSEVADMQDAADWIKDKIRSGERVIPYDAQMELDQKAEQAHYEENLINLPKEVLSDDEINAELQIAANEERESAIASQVFNPIDEDSGTESDAGTQGGTETRSTEQAFSLTGQTNAEINDGVAAEAARVRAQQAETAAAKKAKAERDQAEIDARTAARAANPDNFQFGEDSKQAAAPVADLFGQPSKPDQKQSAITAIKSSDMTAGEKLNTISAINKGDIAPEDVADVVGKSAPIEDFGEKIIGARKEYAAAYKDKMNAAKEVDILAQPLSKSWPEPDYQKLIEAGNDPYIVGMMRSMRDEIPNKPGKSYRQKTWSAQVEQLRDTADKLLNDAEFSARFMDELKKVKHLKLEDAIGGRAELYVLMGHNKSLKGVRISRSQYGVYNGIPQNPPKIIWEVTRDSKATAFGNIPTTLGHGDTRQSAIESFTKAYSALDISKSKDSKTKFELYADRYAKAGDKGQYFIGKKVGRNVIHIKDGFDTVKEARAYIADRNEELTAILEKKKEVPNERYDINQPRVGQDMRNAQDVTPQMFSEAFGFRGVQFGNYVEGARRQKDLNDAYDALMDLAAVLDIPPKALSLNGELGLAFGARGTGGKNPHSAHYESGQIVINLTKGNGAGSLAHEWWHSLDNYFSRQRGKKDGYATDGMDVSLAARWADYHFKDDGIRKEMIDAFGTVVKAINQTSIKERSRSLDNRRTKEYWGTGIEMSARSFERYVIAKLHDNGFANDYLANVVSEEYWKAADALGIGEGGSYPYPTESELPVIRDGFDKFFQTIESKETDKGVALFSRAESANGMPVSAVESIANPIAEKLKNIRTVKVVTRQNEIPGLKEQIDTAFSRFQQDRSQENLEKYLAVAKDNIEGAYVNGELYLVASNLHNAERVLEVLRHEVAHLSVEQMLEEVQPGLYSRLLKNVQTLDKAGNQYIRELAASVDKSQPGLDEDIRAAEIIAQIAERGDHDGDMPSSVRSVWKRIADGIKAFYKLVFGDTLTDQDVRDIVAQSFRWARGEGDAVRVYGGAERAHASRGKQSPESFARMAIEELVAENDPVFSLPVSNSKSIDGVMLDMKSGIVYHGEHTREDERAETGADHRHVFETVNRKTFYVYETDDGKVWIDVSRLDTKGGGQAIYAAVANYAYNTHKKFVGDPFGLSPKAVIRRTSNMLSSALRFGTTRHLEAAQQQIWGDPDNGVEPLDWSGSDIDKVEALIHTFVATIDNLAPSLKEYSYDFRLSEFTDSKGRPVTGAAMAENTPSRAGVGEKTARRYALLRSLLSADSGNVSERSGILERLLVWGDTNATPRNLNAIFSRRAESDVLHGDRREGSGAARSQALIGDNGRNYTPEQRAAFKATGREVETPTIKERFQGLTQNMGKKLAQGLFDQFAPIKDISDEAYRLMRLSKGASGAFEVLLNGGQLKINDGVYDFDESKRGGVVERLLHPLNGEHDDFMWWVAANRAQYLKRQDREHLFSDEDIKAMKSLADGKTDFDYTIQHGKDAGKVTRNRLEIYKDSLVTFNEFNKNAMDMAEQSGLIDKDARKTWESEFYVPFYRVAEESEDGVRGMNVKGGVVRQEAFKKLKGGKDKLNADLLENTLVNWAHLLDAAAKNRAAKETLETADILGVAHPVEAGTKNAVWFMDNGQKTHYSVDDPTVMVALQSLEYAGMNNPMMKAMGQFKHYLTIGVTASPFFKVRNLIRDSVQAIAIAPLDYNVAKNLKQGWKLTDPKSDEYFRLMAGGGTIHFGTMIEGSESKRVRALVEAGVPEDTILNNEGAMKKFYKRHVEPAVTAYNELGNRGEAVNRAALYDQLRKQGMGHQEASFLARDMMDFSMGGSFNTVRFLTQIVPFMNARLQGLYKLGKSAKEDPARFGVVLGSVALTSIALMLLYKDDDDWKKREDWDRDNFWWVKIGGEAYRIPKPFEVGAMASLAERGVEYFATDEMTRKRFMSRFGALLSDNLAMNPIPQIVKPVMDIYANKDSFSGRPIETLGMDRLKPDYRFTQHTSMTARAISTAGNTATFDHFASPVQIDHMIQGYFGWLGSFVVGAGDIAARYATDQPDRPAADYWKVATGGMVQSLDSAQSRYVSQMYDQAKVLEQAYGTWHELLKQGKIEDAREFFVDHQDELGKYKFVEHVKKAESKFNEQIRIIERSNKSADEKRAAIIAIQKRKDAFARLVN